MSINYLARKKEKQIYVRLSGFMDPSKQALYCQAQGLQVRE